MSRAILAPTCAAALLIAGCGSGHLVKPTPKRHAGSNSSGSGTAAHGDSAQVEVIREWSVALQGGNIHGAASYFALPSLFANGAGVGNYIEAVKIRTEHEAELVNESLSCGARLIATQQAGRYITATFRLTNRSGPGADCGTGAGQKAATDFVIRDGHIVEWVRAPLPSTGPSTVPSTPPIPTTPPTPSQQI